MALRRFGLALALAAATLSPGCFWCHRHHRCWYAAPPPCPPAAVPAVR
jgi:hypothetical protein